ncbi:MAG: Tol-Pal system beta propeller repeat protein TolB [Burkholderiaceae bacterium]|jgi:TolB protein|nr:Tol-Pal system beta propeller repeat protein TolB [Burkholderiaceae bacterium]
MHKSLSTLYPSSLALTRRSLITGVACASALSTLPALAQFRVEVTGVGLTQLPIAIAPFHGENLSPQKIAAIVQADLERSGQFRGVDASGQDLDENSRPDMNMWHDRTADSLVVGSVTRRGDGRYDVRFRLWDVVRSQDLGGRSYTVSQEDLRLAAHRIADYVYEKLTGEKGVFATRITYVTKSGSSYQLWVADADGADPKAALKSSEPIISPAWSSNGSQLAYVSFESRKPVVYVQTIHTGQRRLLANFKGNNSAPAWAPNGGSLVISLSRDGASQLYNISAAGGAPRRLTQSPSIDTEPVFSADGSAIYFTSDRGGSPQIYKMGAGGGSAQRITFSGEYSVSPAISPDGRWLAYISRSGGAFKLQVMDLASGSVRSITDTTADEKPSFAANSKLILYVTRQSGRGVLMVTTLDGTIKTPLAARGGDIREPDWGPFLHQQ